MKKQMSKNEFLVFLQENFTSILDGIIIEKDFYDFNQIEEVYETAVEDKFKFKTNIENDKIKKMVDLFFLTVIESPADYKTADKSMMSNAINSESLITTRIQHEEQVQILQKMICEELNLNIELSQCIGRFHDIGHTFNGHLGERILSSIGEYRYSGYSNHNAMGVHILEREKIVERTLERIEYKLPKITKKEKEEFIRFVRYVMDGILSHNGEGTIGKIGHNPDKTMEQMDEETSKCFTEKGFDKKIISASLEGSIMRYADIIAYLRSDIMDGFRFKDSNGKKRITEFDEDYLKVIATILAKKYENTEFLNLENGILLKICKIKIQINEAEKMIVSQEGATKYSKIDQDQMDKLTAGIQEVKSNKKELEEKLEPLLKKYEDFTNIKIEFAKSYINSLNKSEFKTQITDMMQDVFLKDLIENSKGKKDITMSPLIRKTFFELRSLNARKIVPYTRKEFEVSDFPMCINALEEELVEKLLGTGIIYDRILHKEDKKKSKNVLTKTEKRRNIRNINIGDKNYQICERKLYHHYDNLDSKIFEKIYQETLESIRDIASHDIKIILGEEEYKGNLPKEIVWNNKLLPLKSKINTKYPNGINTKEEREELIESIVKEKTEDLEKIIAFKMVNEYLATMTDSIIIIILKEKGLLTEKEIKTKFQRIKDPDPNVKEMENKWSQEILLMIQPDEISQDDEDEKTI